MPENNTVTVPVLWLYGPAGVGKTTVAWGIFDRLRRSEVECAYVDIDQLGMCYPAQPSDPERHRLKARNLSAVVANFAAVGARCVVVSGVVDPARGVEADLVTGAAVVPCRLRADRTELRRRFLGRSQDPLAAEDALREADEFDASRAPAMCVETTGRSPADVTDEVVRRWGGWTALVGSRPPRSRPAALSPAAAVTMPVLFLCGATGVGKSTVGFEIYLRDQQTGLTAGYVDAGQLGFFYPIDDAAKHTLQAANLAAVAASYAAAGAKQLVVTARADTEQAARAYVAALAAADLRLCSLHAGLADLTHRVLERGRGGGWAEPGDSLVGRPEESLRLVAAQAADVAVALDRAGIGVRIDTGGRSVTEVLDLVIGATGWASVSDTRG